MPKSVSTAHEQVRQLLLRLTDILTLTLTLTLRTARGTDVAVGVEENVLELKVAVDDAQRVHVLQRQHQLRRIEPRAG